MLTGATIQKIRRMLKYSGLSQREIARQTGVSRGTVSSIKMKRHYASDLEELEELPPTHDREVPRATRCPGCGGLVYSPCRVCLLRELKRDWEHSETTKEAL